jgi:hypothetical protein
MNQLHDEIVVRLATEGHDSDTWALVVLAALESDAALATYLDGPKTASHKVAATTAGRDPQGEPPGAFVSSISVTGFRGIGRAATLPLKPGPGLTLVVGRNGSGKSSFAEALECLFTGTSYRWQGRPAPWKAGWRNLHERGTAAIKADLIAENLGAVTLARTWKGDSVDDAQTIRRPNRSE